MINSFCLSLCARCESGSLSSDPSEVYQTVRYKHIGHVSMSPSPDGTTAWGPVQDHHKEALCVGMGHPSLTDVPGLAPPELIDTAEGVRAFLKLMENLTNILQKGIEVA